VAESQQKSSSQASRIRFARGLRPSLSVSSASLSIRQINDVCTLSGGDIHLRRPETGTGHALGRERVGHRTCDNDADDHHRQGKPMAFAIGLAGVLGDLLSPALLAEAVGKLDAVFGYASAAISAENVEERYQYVTGKLALTDGTDIGG
jgi:hypothetical protein